MPRGWEESWPLLINKRAAIREQFPTFAQVQRERPGTVEDRERQAFHREQNRVSLRGAVSSQRDREMRDEADADRFIAEMRRREHERFLQGLANRQVRSSTEGTAA